MPTDTGKGMELQNDICASSLKSLYNLHRAIHKPRNKSL